MSEIPSREYLVISRGQWDPGASKETIQRTIDQFYVWLDRALAQGRMKSGSRLGTTRAVVSRGGIVTDGPFAEAKELIGGYWWIVARSLEEAATLALENPCLQLGLQLEIRPLEPERASANVESNESRPLRFVRER